LRDCIQSISRSTVMSGASVAAILRRSAVLGLPILEKKDENSLTISLSPSLPFTV